jgi:hypothetical protein
LDFILTNLPEIDTGDLSTVLYEAADLRVHDFGRARLVCGKAPAAAGQMLVIFSGYAIRDGRVIHHLKHADHPSLGVDALAGSDGVFSVVEYSRDRIRVLSDPTGQYAVFALRKGKAFAVSNNINLIERLAAQNGLDPRRSGVPLAFTLAVGTNIGTPSSMDDVELLKPLHLFEVDADGRLSETRYADRRSVYTSASTYQDDLAAARAHIRSVCQGILGLGMDRVAVDVTGGVDSRLVLAFFMNAVGKDGFEVLNIGRAPNPDRLVADHFVAKYGLRAGRFADHSVDVFPDPDESSRIGVFRYAGMRLKDTPDISTLRRGKIARVSGAYGEMSYGLASVDAIEALLQSGPAAYAAAWVDGRGFNTSMLTRDAYEFVKASIAGIVGDIIHSGVPMHQVDEVFYNENRARNHFGFAYRFNNDVRVHIPPLNTLTFAKCCSHLPYRKTRNRLVAFDLMLDLMGPEFTLEPMAKDKWAPGLSPLLAKVDYRKVERVKADTPPWAPSAPFQWGGGAATDEAARRTSAKAPRWQAAETRTYRGMSGRFRQVSFYQQLGLDMVERIAGNDPIWDLIDRNKLTAALRMAPDALMSAKVEKPRSYAGNMANVAHGLLWYAGGEKALTIDAGT